MRTKHPTLGDESPEVEQLRRRLEEAEETLHALRTGQVDAVVVSGPKGEQIFVLKGAEQPYRVFVETMNEGAVTLLADGTIAYSNGRFAEMVKTPLEQVIGRAFEEFVAPDHRDRWKALVACGLLGNCKEEMALLSEGGDAVWAELSLSPVQLDTTIGICLIVSDITERKRAEELRAYLAAIVDTTDDAIIGKDLDGTILSWNAGAKKLYGYAAREVMGRSIAMLVPPDRVDEAFGILQRVGRGERIESFETERIRKDGQRIHVSLTVSTVRDAEGRIDGVSTIARDITERKRMEQALRDLNENLERLVAERTAELQAILDAAPVPIWIAHDAECRRITGNVHADQTVMQVPRGGNISASASPGEAAVSYKMFRKGRELRPEDMPAQVAAATGRPVTAEEEVDLVFPDGRTVSLLLCAAPLLDVEGRVRGAVTAGADVTNLRRVERALRDSEERLDLALRASQEGVWDWNCETRAVWYSSRWKEMLGYAESEIEPHASAWERLLHPDDQLRVGAALEAFQLGQQKFEVEFRLRHKDGHYVDILSRGIPVRREAGGPVVRMVGTHFDLTERKRAEASLRLFRRLIDASNDGVQVIDPETLRFLDVNERACQDLGYSRAELLSLTVFDIDPAFDRSAQQGLDAELLKSGAVRFERVHRRKDGSTYPVELTLRNVQLDRVYGVCIVRDITERKAADEALRESMRRERFLAEILESSEQAFGTGYPDGRMGTCNRAYCELTGYSLEELQGISWRTVLTPPEWLEPEKAALAEIERTGKPVRFEKEYVRKDGRRVPVEVLAHVQRYVADKVLYYSFVTDITERKRVAEALQRSRDELEIRVQERTQELSATNAALSAQIEVRKRAETALQESEEAFRTLAELVPQLVWMCNPDGLNVYFNQRWVKYTGLTLDESYGKGWSTPFHPDDKQPAWDAWNHAVETGDTYRTECRLRRADGTYHWFLTKGEPLHDATGRIVRWFGTCTDIDDMKRTQEELDLRARELARSNAELQQFAYIASHDLQEPLRAVASFTKLLGERYRGRLDADADEFIEFAVDGARSAQRLIHDLLVYSRVGTRAAPFSPTDCEAVLEEVLADLAAAIEESGGQVTHEPLPVVDADKGQLGQVFQNLIGNALKFHGQEAPHVHVSAQRRSGAWCFSVRDNGIGIEPQHFDEIFAVFQRLHSSTEYPGTGIGLAIVKKIVERHGGRIWVESEPGKGAAFYFTVPAKKGIPHAA